ncbi:uncharacterized protein LOC113866173 [Abrus precatorius]|uniref:Uncharacterized protein LOC113866173 n=1 Tax=Abrus precatorius TaxID=3816 RepID=A0A8B8LLN3_ABRPR|nr:uncharacterized protein LOC113866173 [Abrus precatorius]
MAIDLIDATLKAKRNCNKKSKPDCPLTLYSEARYLLIRLPNSKFIKMCFGLLLLALALTSLPFIMGLTLLEKISSSHQAMPNSFDHINYDSTNTNQVFSNLFPDLTNEDVMNKKQQKAQLLSNEGLNLAAPRKLCGYSSEAKKAALEKLEDVLLEPPRAASGKSRKYLKRTRYLPDLMGDSLESYPRHIFIDVGLPEKEGGSGTDWFRKNYPTRKKNFEIYKIETETEESSGKEVSQIGMSDWLRKNVKDEEYVVMKAEAEVVDEIMRGNSIGLVDELFLECKPKQGNKRNRSRRAYWECLALYGMLRDEGVAVHQWWG